MSGKPRVSRCRDGHFGKGSWVLANCEHYGSLIWPDGVHYPTFEIALDAANRHAFGRQWFL